MPDIAPDKPTSRRRWLQFRLRTLLLLVAVVAVSCWWFKGKWDRKQAERKAVAEINRLGGTIRYEWQLNVKQPKKQPPGPALLRKLLGEDFLAHVTCVHIPSTPGIDDSELVWLESLPDVELLLLNGHEHVTDAGVQHIQGLSKLRVLDLCGTHVTDVGLKLATFPEIEELRLGFTLITDDSLIHAADMAHLKKLQIHCTKVTNEGVKVLAGRSKLECLWLDQTNTDDDALRMIGRMTTLTELHIGGSRITNESLAHLQSLNRLEELSIIGSPITDDGLLYVGKLTNLRHLDLISMKITSAGLEHLLGLQHLAELCLVNTKVTKKGVARLQEALPKCKIRR